MFLCYTNEGTKSDKVWNQTIRKYFEIEIQENEIKHTAICACFKYWYQQGLNV